MLSRSLQQTLTHLHLTISCTTHLKISIMFFSRLLLQVDPWAQYNLDKKTLCALLPTVLTVTMGATPLELDHIVQIDDLNPHQALRVITVEKKQVISSLFSRKVRQIDGHANFASKQHIDNMTLNDSELALIII